MKRSLVYVGIIGGILIFFACFSLSIAQKSLKPCVNKKLCKEMIRKGKEAYLRGRYLEAKGYFKKAIQADPNSKEAWIGYDLSVIYALAQKVERNTNYLKPETPKLEEKTPPTPYPEKQKEEEGFVIEEDEGC